MKINIFQQLQDIKAWQLKLFLMLFSVLLTEIIVASMGLLLKGYVPFDYLLTGLVASCFMAFLILLILIQFREKSVESQLQLLTIIENQPECVKLLAKDGTLLQMNRAGLNMIEADAPDQVIGHRIQQILLPEYRNAFIALTKQVFEGKSGNLEFEIRGFKGTHRWLETHSVPLRDSHGNITALLSVTRDITERRKMEEELRRSRDELLKYFEQPFIGMLTASHDKQTLHVNQRFCDIVGYSQEEMQHIDWGKLTYSDDLAANQAYLDQAIRGEIDSYQMEKRYIHKDGHIVYVDLAVQCVRKADGIPEYFVGMMLDITERKKMEQQLRDSETFISSILNSLTSHIAVLDSEGVIIAINNAWRQFAEENDFPKANYYGLGTNYLSVCQKLLIN